MSIEKGQHSEDIKNMLHNAVEARDIISNFHREMGRIDPIYESLLRQISNRLNAIERTGNQLFSRTISEPLGKYLTGRQLSREEFYSLRLMDLPLPMFKMKDVLKVSWDEYEFFTLFCYADGVSRCYINPWLVEEQEVEDEPGIRLSKFVAPEELLWDGLRPEQKEFFVEYLPEIVERFKR